MQMKQYLDVLPEIQHALDHNLPVVALESTILSHGMPYPENVSFAAEVEKVVRAEGAVPATTALIDGFESPFGMELLATVDWLLTREEVQPTVPALREGLCHWRGGDDAAQRKYKLSDDRVLGIALKRLTENASAQA